jgi:hypothetical protein
VLIGAIEQGVSSMTWESDTFAYAEAYDEQEERYLGLRAGEHMAALIDSASVLVKPEVARAQLDEEAPVPPPPGGEEGAEAPSGEELPVEPELVASDGKPHRFSESWSWILYG